jgi:sulfur relay (sulfurtransferase) complex TusBCD TusD component (DsrE family)
MDLRGKKLGLLLSAGPEQANFHHCLRVAETALDQGIEVYLYCLDDAVRGATDARWRVLHQRGLRLFACAYALQRRGLADAGPAVLSGLTVVGDIIAGTDRFLSFN